MNNYRRIYDINPILFLLTCALIVTFAFSSVSWAEQNNKTDVSKDVEVNSSDSPEKKDDLNSTTQKSISGYEVYIDPKTGKFLNPPKDMDTSTTRGENETNSLETQEEDESIIELPAIGGGVMIEKPEGFLHDSTATIDAEGKLHINCSEHDSNVH